MQNLILSISFLEFRWGSCRDQMQPSHNPRQSSSSPPCCTCEDERRDWASAHCTCTWSRGLWGWNSTWLACGEIFLQVWKYLIDMKLLRSVKSIKFTIALVLLISILCILMRPDMKKTLFSVDWCTLFYVQVWNLKVFVNIHFFVFVRASVV